MALKKKIFPLGGAVTNTPQYFQHYSISFVYRENRFEVWNMFRFDWPDVMFEYRSSLIEMNYGSTERLTIRKAEQINVWAMFGIQKVKFHSDDPDVEFYFKIPGDSEYHTLQGGEEATNVNLPQALAAGGDNIGFRKRNPDGTWFYMSTPEHFMTGSPNNENPATTFSTDGLVKVNDATPVSKEEVNLISIIIKQSQADDGSVKVEFTTFDDNQTLLGTFIHKGYEWYVDPTTYKSWKFNLHTFPPYDPSGNEITLIYQGSLPDGEHDRDSDSSLTFANATTGLPFDTYVAVPLESFENGAFYFNGETHNGTEPLWRPLTEHMPVDHYSSYVLVNRHNAGPDFLMHPSDTMPIENLSTVTDITVVTEQNNTHGYTKIKYYKLPIGRISFLYDQLRDNVIDAHTALENELLSEFMWEWATPTADHNLYVKKFHEMYSHLNEYQTPNLFYYPLNEENYSVNNDATLFLHATNSTLSVTNPTQAFSLDGDQRIYSTRMIFGNGVTGPLTFIGNPLFGKQIPTGTAAPYNNIQFRLSGIFNQSEELSVYMDYAPEGSIPSGAMNIFANFDRTAANAQFTRGKYSAVPYVMSSDYDSHLPNIKQLTFVDERTGIDAGDFYATHIMLTDATGQTQIVRAMDSASANALVVPADENISRLIFGGTTRVVFENLGSASYELPKIVNVQPIV